jgi:hypothetical protein
MKHQSIAAITLLTLPAFAQSPVVLHSGEAIFTISVRGGNGVEFRGSCLSTPSEGAAVTTELKGKTPAEFTIAATAIYLTIQNLTGGREPEVRVGSDGRSVLDLQSPNAQTGSWLEVEISRNGGSVKRQRTDAPHGVISLGTAPAATGGAIRTELQVEGVRFAFITFTSDTGDIEQQLVPVPVGKVFYPKEGSIVGLTAQKTRVTRLDPVHTDGTIEILDDGTNGEVHVAIRVNGQLIGSAHASEPFGVASTTVKIP